MDLFQIPNKDVPIVEMKYNKEILEIISNNNNSQNLLNEHLTKIKTQNIFENQTSSSLPNQYCLKIKDSFQSKKISFVLIISENKIGQLKLRINLKKHVFEEFEESIHLLISYLTREVINKLFMGVFVCQN